MSDNTNIDNQQIIDEYETKKAYFDGLRDDISNLEKAIIKAKADIKNTIDTQNRMKQSNYEIWSQLENKDTVNSKNAEQKDPTIEDKIGSFKL